VALRPRISPGLLLSESYIWYGIALPSQSVVVKEWGRGRCLIVEISGLRECLIFYDRPSHQTVPIRPWAQPGECRQWGRP
jgi:hypothetical protein